ncbi:hypothetical protein RB595_005022 [Gaeumannomyces hyphopodioides]
MPSFAQTLAVLASALAIVSASPIDTKVGTPQQGQPLDFSVSQVANPKGPVVKNGALALARTYQKFGKPLPPALAAAVQNATAAASLTRRAGGSGSATTTPAQFDVEYLTPVKIGTPGVTLNLDFDTGSSDLWCFSGDLPSSQQRGHSVYSPSKSSTSSRLSGSTWSIRYGDGSNASGNVYTDVVSIGGVSFRSQAVETASRISSSFTQGDSDGLVGLAFSSINTVSPRGQKTFFDNVKSSLSSPVMGVDLKHGAPGHYDFGTLPSGRYTGSIAYVSVDNSQGFWSFTASGYAVGGGQSSRKRLTGIADTGTTLLLLDDSVVDDYYSQVSGAENSASEGGYVMPCSATPPDFSFNVGSNTITIPGSFISYAPVSDGSSTCFGGIQSDASIGFSIFGDIALKAAYVVFDGSSTPRLGWANKNL